MRYPETVRSLRSRLFLLWLLALAAALALGWLLNGLYRQSSTAQIDRAEEAVTQGCARIAERFAYYATGWAGPVTIDASLRADLTAVVTIALEDRPALAGGIWQTPDSLLATTTQLPANLEPALADLATSEDDTPHRLNTSVDTILLEACPLRGPLPGLVGFTWLRVASAPGQRELQLGLAVLLALALGMTALLGLLVTGYARRVALIESALADTAATLPPLAPTGERELDRIVASLNMAGSRLAAAQQTAADLAIRVAQSERLAALGRVAAGVAHEIRNPIAAMRLQAENALFGDDARRRAALGSILAQIDRLDRLLGELLTMTQRRDPAPVPTPFPDFLETIAADHRHPGIAIIVHSPNLTATIDPDLLRRALDSVVQNAIRHTPDHGSITLSAQTSETGLQITIADTGPGVPEALRETLFEPFVTGAPEGTGLGLAIARELIQAHGGEIHLQPSATGAVFTIELPCPIS